MLPQTDVPAPAGTRRAKVLTSNSGGAGARPAFDGLSATAFPSGMITIPVEATEHAGPVIIWRKELRADFGGIGKTCGGLGQFMEVSAREGHEFNIQAMFHRANYPARGRRGGGVGAATTIARYDCAKMNGKGKQLAPHGHRVMMAFSGGGRYGDQKDRTVESVKCDLAREYTLADSASRDYGLSANDIAAVQAAVAKGEAI